MKTELTQKIVPILEAVTLAGRVEPIHLRKLHSTLEDREHRDLLFHVITVLLNKNPASNEGLETLYDLLEQYLDDRRLVAVAEILRLITDHNETQVIATRLAIRMLERMALDTPEGILDRLSMKVFSSITEGLFRIKYYGLIIKICLSHPSLKEDSRSLFRIAQSFGALDQTENALDTLEIAKGLKLAADEIQSIALVESSLFHRIGENDRGLSVLESVGNNNEHRIYAALYGYHHYSDTWTREQIESAATSWAKSSKKFKKSVPKKGLKRTHNRGLKIGFISHNFNTHPVGWMTAGLFTTLAEDESLSLFHYDCKPSDDFVAKTLKVKATNWKDLDGFSASEVFDTIQKDDLDLLIDLDGLSANNHFDVVCSRPSRRTAKWVGGLIGSTYNSAIDYLIADERHCPEHLQHLYTEQLILLDDIYATYTPPPYQFYERPLPTLGKGFVTYGCFNNAAKLSDLCLSTWAKILNQNSTSRLFLKDKFYGDSFARNSIAKRWVKAGGDPTQLMFAGASPHKNHLEVLQKEVDICLDPIPYSGGLSTLEALFLGVPVVTLSGELLSHRHSTAYLSCLGLYELICSTQESYVETAISLANQIDMLQDYRSTLRDKLLSSPLLNHEKFAEDFRKKIGLMV